VAPGRSSRSTLMMTASPLCGSASPKLERRIAILTAVLRLVLALLRVSGLKLELSRVPDAAGKRRLLGAIEHARRSMPLSAALRVLRLSAARYHAWARGDGVCMLDDRPSCPRSMVQRLTYGEVEAIGDMVQSTEHRHMSIRGLALYAQRAGKVFAHPGTWGKLVRERGWRRPRLRLYPAKPKIGLRTHAPNEAWHIDVTIIKLLDGTKAYVHAVIDNFSRRILAWTCAGRLDPMNTHDVLTRAAAHLVASTNVFMDSGVENLNGDVGPALRARRSAARHRSDRRDLLELAHRSLVALPKASLAVPAPARQPRGRLEARRVLRDGAQRANPPRRF